MDAQQNIDGTSSQTNENEVVLPATESIGTSFQHFNEYCLLEIFAHLTPIDLCSVADTCKRFQRITQRVFPKKFEISVGCYGRKHNFKSETNFEAHLTTQAVERVLTNFGQYLSTLSICENDPVVMDSVAKYCVAGTLQRIHFCTVYDSEQLRANFKSIFQRLLVLSFHGEYVSSLRDAKRLNLNFDSLIRLEIVNVKKTETILMSTFPKLERFIFRDYYCDDSDALVIFLLCHGCITALDLGVTMECSDDVAHAIGNSWQLEELTLRNFCPSMSFDFAKLENLSKLKMLEVDLGLSEYMQPIQLAALLKTFAKSLEIVKIWILSEDPDEIVDALSELPNLRRLELNDYSYHPIQWTKLTQLTKLTLSTTKRKPVTPEELLHIISKLEYLEKFKVRRFELTEKVFTQIDKIVELRSNVLRLKCGYSLPRRLLRNRGENPKFELIKRN